MSAFARPVVPVSIDRVKRIAKQLHEIYPRQPLSACQATVAHLLGHKDWHAIEQAIKRNDPPGIFDAELARSSKDEFLARRKEQRAILCRELSGVDPDKEYPVPETTTESALEQAAMGMMSPHGKLRLENAAARYQIRLATEALAEVAPSMETHPSQKEFPDFACVWTSAELERLPSYLGQWWSVNIPYQPEVGEALRKFKLDPNRKISLLHFGAWWGSLCTHYSSVINWSMCMGTAYLLAERYASLYVQDSPEYQNFKKASDEVLSDTSEEGLLSQIADMQLQFVRFYLDVYQRDDFASVFSGQPDAFIKNAKDCIKIFANPKSKKGTWKH